MRLVEYLRLVGRIPERGQPVILVERFGTLAEAEIFLCSFADAWPTGFTAEIRSAMVVDVERFDVVLVPYF